MDGESLDVTVGENIKRLREAHGYSQAQVAEFVGDGWRQQTVLKIEKGSRPLRLAEAVAVAEFLSVEVKALYRPPSAAGQQLAQLTGVFKTVRQLYENAVREVAQLEDWRLDMALMLRSTNVDALTPQFREALEQYTRDGLVEACVEEARNTWLVRTKREDIENG